MTKKDSIEEEIMQEAVDKTLKPTGDIFDKMIKEITKKHGGDSISKVGAVNPQFDIKWMSTGILSLDKVMGKGIPEGRIIEIYGPESGGKSTLSLHIAKRFLDAGRRVVYVDAENAFDPAYAEQLGININDGNSKNGLFLNQPKSGEEALDIVEKMCLSNGVGLIIVDSVAQLVPMANLNKDIDGPVNIGTTARLLSQNLPRIANAAKRSGTTIIFINQIRMMIGQAYGNPETTPGGRALRFASTIRLEVRGQKAEERNGVEGIPVTIRAKKNKVTNPGRVTELFLIFGKGFDADLDLLEMAVQFNVIEKTGGWFKYGELKAHGFENFRAELKKFPDIKAEILDILDNSL